MSNTTQAQATQAPKKSPAQAPVILSPELTEYVRLLESIARRQGTLTRDISRAVQAAVNDILNSKRPDRANLLAQHLRQLKGVWPRIRQAIIFASGGYTRDPKGVYWANDETAIAEYNHKQNEFVLRPQTDAHYKAVKAVWDIDLCKFDYTQLHGKERAASFSAREELAKFMKRLENNRTQVLVSERQLLENVLKLLASLDEEER